MSKLKIGDKIKLKSGSKYEIIQVFDGEIYDLQALQPHFDWMPKFRPVYYSIVLQDYVVIKPNQKIIIKKETIKAVASYIEKLFTTGNSLPKKTLSNNSCPVVKPPLSELTNNASIKYAKLKHEKEYNNPLFAKNIAETELDFARGFVAGYIVRGDTHNKLIELTKRHKLIMDEKNIIISVYTSGSGFLWSFSKLDSGTDLGWCDHNGDCKMSGTFTTYEKALEDALNLIDKCDLDQFVKETPNDKFHWGNYSHHLDENYR